jgi:predicted DNA binding protein
VRQREVFDLAVRHGYYDTPRRITLTKLASKVGVSKSTLCEMIQLIEHRIIEEFSESVRRKSPKD